MIHFYIIPLRKSKRKPQIYPKAIMIKKQQIPEVTNQRSGSKQSRTDSQKCQRSKTSAHFSIPDKNQNHKKKHTKSTLKQKTSVADKQIRKLNKQSRNVKQLQQEYRELEVSLMDIKQMVKIQLEVIGCSDEAVSEAEKSEQSLQKLVACNNKKNNAQAFNKQSIVSKETQKIDITHLQTLITSLFSYNDTIQVTNSNYLLLSQVNKQQQSQTLFHINNLEDRIRQLRFLLNEKEDLLAYELATLNQGQVLHKEEDQPQQVIIDYHLPRRIALTNQNSMECQFRLVQKAIKEINELKLTVGKLQGQLQAYEKTHNNQENEEIYNSTQRDMEKEKRYMEKGRKLEQEGYQTSRTHNKQIQSFQHGGTIKPFQPTNQFHNNLTVPLAHRAQTNKSSRSIQKQAILVPTQLMLLPLSISNYKSSLIYRVGKLEQLEKQRKQDLNKVYQKLVEDYQNEMKTKKTLIQEYQIKRDVYAYKKKQLQQYQSKKMLKKIAEDQEEYNSQNEVNLQNILSQIHDQEESENVTKDKPNIIEQSTIIQVAHSTLINVKPSHNQHSLIQINDSLASTTQKNAEFFQQKSPCKQKTKEDIFFNEIINSVNIPRKKLANPFLKLKDLNITRKHSYQPEEDLLAKQSTVIQSGFSSIKAAKQNLSQKQPQYMISNALQQNNSTQVNKADCNKLQICDAKQLMEQQTNQAKDVQERRSRTPRRGRRELTRKKFNPNRQNQRGDFQICN